MPPIKVPYKKLLRNASHGISEMHISVTLLWASHIWVTLFSRVTQKCDDLVLARTTTRVSAIPDLVPIVSVTAPIIH
jgi:hypothetical protein